LTREFLFNGKFVTSSPKRPTLYRKENPHEASRLNIKRIQDLKPLLFRFRVLVHPKHVPHPTPKELS
jgi:hypothetical protein